MNTLSWMMYLASIVGAFRGFLFLVIVMLVIGLTIAVLVSLLWHSPTVWSCDDREAKISGFKAMQGRLNRFIRKAPPYLLLAILLFTITPGRNTVYAIAASELGESALNSETGSKAVRALDAWLDRQIASNGRGE